MKYHCRFSGRKSGAIGICYWIFKTVSCNDPSEVRSILYQDYEHITRLTITPINK